MNCFFILTTKSITFRFFMRKKLIKNNYIIDITSQHVLLVINYLVEVGVVQKNS